MTDVHTFVLVISPFPHEKLRGSTPTADLQCYAEVGGIFGAAQARSQGLSSHGLSSSSFLVIYITIDAGLVGN